MICYSSPDGRNVETVRVVLSGRGMRATGYIVSASHGAYGASYVLIADAAGLSRRLTVRCSNAEGERSLSLTRSPGGPWLAEGPGGATPLPALASAHDIYLGGSAFTASLAIRRLGLHESVGEATVTVASISMPSLAVHPVEHHGRTESVDDEGAKIAYSGPFGDRTILVDRDGLLIASPGLAARLD